MIATGRPREGMVLMRGAHQLALANDLADVELNARVLLTFFEQWGDPAAGLALAREGLEIGRRTGSRNYGFNMVGNGSICAFAVGEWDWAATTLDEWLAVEAPAAQRAEFYIDRAILRSLRGHDSAADSEEAERLRSNAGITDPQWQSYEHWARAWAAFAAGDLANARALAVRAIEITDYFTPLTWPLAVRAALWSGDATAARRVIEDPAILGFAGALVDADKVLARAGMDALESRWTAAMTGFREALRAYRASGALFFEAAATVDMATLVPPSERSNTELDEAIAAARETLTRLGSTPFLDRLERAPGAAPTRASRSTQARTGAPVR